MNIMLVHNRYVNSGGEDVVFEQEFNLLKSNGHKVFSYVRHNNELEVISNVRAGVEAIWSKQSQNKLESVLIDNNVEVLHCHNLFARLSPSVYYSAKKLKIPVVQTLHNYRLICPSATMFRQGNVCDECVGRFPLSSLKYSCYKSSYAATGGLSLMLGVHRVLGTWRNQVNQYVAVSEFVKGMYIRGGLPEERIVVKPNFLEHDPGIGCGGGGYILYVGRLSQEKGIEILLNGWRNVNNGLVLKIIGDGPLRTLVERFAAKDSSIEFNGICSKSEVLSMMKEAELLVVPSLWHEPFGLVVIEAFATGLPVVTTGQGALSELVEDSVTGLHYKSFDSQDMADKINYLVASPSIKEKLSKNARKEYEEKYTEDKNYEMLHDIYNHLIN